MGLDNRKALDELKHLEQQVNLADDLAALKPIFFRLEEIAKENVHDFDVQLAVGDIKQHLVNRGTKIKQVKDTGAKEAQARERKEPPPPAADMAPTVAIPMPRIPVSGPPAEPPAPPPPPPWPAEAGPKVPPSASGIQPRISSQPAPPAPPPNPFPPATEIMPPVAAVPPQGPWATTENTPVSKLDQTQLGTVPTTPTASAKPPVKPPAKPPATPVAKSSGPPPNLQRALPMGIIVGLLIVAAIGLGAVLYKRHKRELAAKALIEVQVATTPPGASIRVDGDAQCTSNCTLSLKPGNYQITAFLDGYEPAASGIAVAPGQPVSVNLTLDPQAQSLRIITDLDSGKVVLDNGDPEDLQEGQFILDRLLPGSHTVKVTGKSGEATFAFDIADAKQPVITGPVTARNLDTVLVASLGTQAHVVTNGNPMKLAVNGQPEGDTSSAGVDLKNFQAGVDELVVGEGADQHSVKENFGPAPMITAFLKSDLNAGTLVVSTGEDDVRIFLNNKEYPRHTQRGSLRIQTIGPVSVRVSKDGFEATPPAQNADVKKGAETRVEFKMKALPRFGTLQISGGTPGAEVVIDGRSLGTIGGDGSLSSTNVAPGDHAIEIRLTGYGTKKLTRTFKAGDTVSISGADSALTAIPQQPQQVAKKVEPVPAPKQEAPPPPAPKAGTMADWQNPSAWKMDGGIWVHQGAGFIPYALTPQGVFTFTVELIKGGGIFHGGKVRWALDYTDAKNYALYEMDNKNFWAKVVMNGKTFERTHTQIKDLEKQKSFTIQIDVTPEHIVHKMFTGGDWINLDSWAETGRNFSEGKFGFLIQGNDEIGLADFKFQPK